jgi:hypothetical protein
MPSILFHWRRETYEADRDEGWFGYGFRSASPRLHLAGKGDHVWAFTRNRASDYVLAARLLVKSRHRDDTYLRPYHVTGERRSTTYFDVEVGPSVELVIRHKLGLTVQSAVLGRSFQGNGHIQPITPAGHAALEAFLRSEGPDRLAI